MAGYPGPAELRETHTGLVVLYDDRAYKLKKAVHTDFLDFSTPSRREFACEREVELNRRLAPDVYLGTGHLSDPGGGPAEPVIVMRRMPEDSRLSNILDDPSRSSAELSALAEVLVEFHNSARRGPEIDAQGSGSAIGHRWHMVLHTISEQPAELADPVLIERIRQLSTHYLDGREALLANRIATGNIVDGHGDLQAEDIFELPDGFRVLDCLDFDDQLRYVDRLDDIAFLAMDLEFRGHPGLAEQFLDKYQELAADPAPPSLREHYLAYRALVRAKVDTIRFNQGEQAARDRLRRHLDLALHHLERATVRLVLIGGSPGSGKSTVARELSRATGAIVLSSDELRAQLRARGEVTGESGTFGAGAYSAEAKARVYSELRARAGELLAAGHSVILDASWIDADERERATALADRAHAALVALRCHCPPSVAERRIRSRVTDDSEATPQIAAAMSAIAAQWPQAVPIDTGLVLTDTVTIARRAWDAEAPTHSQQQPGAQHRPEPAAVG